MFQELKMSLCSDASEQYAGVRMERQFAPYFPPVLKNDPSHPISDKVKSSKRIATLKVAGKASPRTITAT